MNVMREIGSAIDDYYYVDGISVLARECRMQTATGVSRLVL